MSADYIAGWCHISGLARLADFVRLTYKFGKRSIS